MTVRQGGVSPSPRKFQLVQNRKEHQTPICGKVITKPQLEKDATCDCPQHACRVGSVASNGVSHQCTFSTLLENQERSQPSPHTQPLSVPSCTLLEFLSASCSMELRTQAPFVHARNQLASNLQLAIFLGRPHPLLLCCSTSLLVQQLLPRMAASLSSM